jgi:hypothetical protein
MSGIASAIETVTEIQLAAPDYVLSMRDFASSASQGKPPEKFVSHLREHHPEDIPVLLRFRQQVQHDPLTSTYWSQVPYAFGLNDRTVCRYRCSLLEGVVETTTAGSSPDYLRERMIERLSPGRDEVVFDFAAQIKIDADKSVIEGGISGEPISASTIWFLRRMSGCK